MGVGDKLVHFIALKWCAAQKRRRLLGRYRAPGDMARGRDEVIGGQNQFVGSNITDQSTTLERRVHREPQLQAIDGGTGSDKKVGPDVDVDHHPLEPEQLNTGCGAQDKAIPLIE